MDTGRKPALFVVRDFRGSRLYLQSQHAGNGMRWTTDAAKALALSTDDAMSAADRASREWGARCACVDTITGTIVAPAAAQSTIKPIGLTATLVAALRISREARTAGINDRHKLGCACDHCEGLRGGAQS